MTTPDGELCASWADLEDVCCTVPEGSEAVMQDMLAAASWLLYVKTGSQWPGVCQEVVRPFARRAGTSNTPVWHGVPLSSWGGWGMTGYGFDWGWNASWGECGCDAGGCSCSGPSRIQLGGFPIVAVNNVLIDGAQVPATEYEVVDWGWLQRLPDPSDPLARPRHWPTCQRMDLPFTSPHTFAIDYSYGAAPPTAGRLAAASWACDLFAACVPGDCAIPKNVANMLRENVQYEFRVEDTPTIQAGLTGNALADEFIQTVNPGAIGAPATVWSPDVGPMVRRVT